MTEVLSHHLEGTGPPVLLLNGIMMSMPGWEPVVRDLARDHLVIRCDLRGQLLSPGPVPRTIQGQATEVVSLLDHLKLDAVHVVGTSFGALTGITLAALHPSRVSSLAAITTTERADESMQPLFESLRAGAVRAAAGGDKAAVFDAIVPWTFSAGYLEQNAEAIAQRREAVGRLPDWWFSSYAVLLESTRDVDLRPLLPRIASPALVVGSECDRLFPLEHSRTLAAGIPGARLEIVPAGTHGLVVERPADVAALVRALVESVIA